MAAEEVIRTSGHTVPCPDLIDLRGEVRKQIDRINVVEKETAGNTTGLKDSTSWQARLEARINQLFYIALAATLTAVVNLAIQLYVRH